MNHQDIFTKAYLSLASQGFKKSVNTHDHCMYRAPNGLKCAIGHLIPDELYHPGLEERTPYGEFLTLFTVALGIDVHLTDSDGYWLCRLQSCHDHSKNPEHLKRTLVDFAREYGLETPPHV